MIEHPFALLAPFKETIDVKFFTREDDVSDDASVEKALGTNRFVTLDQMHGNKTFIADHPVYRTEQADAAATSTKDLTLVMRVADCQPFVMYAPKHNVIGMIHAGWKGVAAGMIPAFFRKISDEWGIAPRDTFVCAGPSLCLQCAGFTDPRTELPTVDPRFFHGRFVDLRAAADAQLEDAGVPKANIERSPDCTKCMHEKYWSYRSKDEKAFTENYRNMLTIRLRK